MEKVELRYLLSRFWLWLMHCEVNLKLGWIVCKIDSLITKNIQPHSPTWNCQLLYKKLSFTKMNKNYLRFCYNFRAENHDFCTFYYMIMLLILARKFRLIFLSLIFNLSDKNSKMTHSVTSAYFSGDASIKPIFFLSHGGGENVDLFSQNSES